MAKYKFKVGNKDSLDDERVNKHKDFKKLMHNYDNLVRPLYKTPMYKRRNAKILLTLLVILLIAYLLSELS